LLTPTSFSACVETGIKDINNKKCSKHILYRLRRFLAARSTYLAGEVLVVRL